MVDNPPHQYFGLEGRAVGKIGPDGVERGPDSPGGRSKKTEKYLGAALSPCRAVLQGLQTSCHPIAQVGSAVFEAGLQKIEGCLQLGIAALLVQFADKTGETAILAIGSNAIPRNKRSG